ncbi:MAG: hypothetical protein O3B21_14710 [Proteobacteria bacterium]|nr:hypothetical protein [Pseudomonadota bacterium]MDA1354942.1 hypothetical protein [Pseudomonadota bacterium]
MSLAEKLADIKAGGVKNIPKDWQTVMGRSLDELRASGIMEGVIKAGDKLPDFTLNNDDGSAISSKALLADGPLVLTFFRGHW